MSKGYESPSPLQHDLASDQIPAAFIVVDTNFLLSNLTLVQSVQAWHSKYKHVIIIPWMVMEELDRLKSNKQIEAKVKRKLISALAREAIRWAQESLRSKDEGVRGQQKHETTDESALADDAILACCVFFKSRFPAPVTLLTNDNNLAVKAQAYEIIALSNTAPNSEPLSAELLIRQALHGLLPLESKFIRPKEGGDTCMLDLSGTAEDHLKFLPGLNASRHAPKSPLKGNNQPRVAIDPNTGAAMLVKNHEIRRAKDDELANSYNLDGIEGANIAHDGLNCIVGNTYADIMALASEANVNEEMDWE